MATKRAHYTATTGWTVYAAVFRLSDGKVFDWNDNTWKVLASATTPAVAMSSLANLGGGLSVFACSINLTTVNNTTTPLDLIVIAFHQAGGSPDPDTADDALGECDSITVASGDIVASDGPLGTGFQVVSVTDTTTTSGDNSHIKVQLLDANGQLIDLSVADPTATCAIDVQRDGVHTQFTLSTGDVGAPNANGWFEADMENPDWQTDCGYTVIATIVTGGKTYKGLENLNVWP